MPVTIDMDELQETLEGHEDETVVWLMLGLLAPAREDVPMWAGYSDNWAALTRCVFTEIVGRWLPQDVCEAAVERLYADAVADDDERQAVDSARSYLDLVERLENSPPWAAFLREHPELTEEDAD